MVTAKVLVTVIARSRLVLGSAGAVFAAYQCALQLATYGSALHSAE